MDNELIEYSDFKDILLVILESRNWENSFESLFGDKDDISVSFHRLAPIRNSIAHNRQLSDDDHITLLSEANRILGRLGRGLLFAGMRTEWLRP